MERVSELILRNSDRLSGGEILLINPPRDACFRQLERSGRKVHVFTQDFGDFCWFKTSGAEAEFGAIPDPGPQIESIVLVQPRERERLCMMLHALAANMPVAARLWLAGEIRSGIKSSKKHLDLHFETVNRMDYARHCVLFEASGPHKASPFDLSAYVKSWAIEARIGKIEVKSLPGTFAHGRLDQGTRLLLETLQEQEPAGRILDFACGNGIIGLFLLNLNSGIDLTLLDSSALAIESTRRTLHANRRTATVLASDGLGEVTETYDWIISNPPFHRGIDNDLEIAGNFFSEAGKFLTKTGKILLVCNHHLPYAAWLKSSFTQVEIIKANREFKLILASGMRKQNVQGI